MPSVNCKAFEDSRRHQLVSEFQVYPQTASLTNYQVKATPSSSSKEDIRIIQKSLLPHWAESLGNIWTKLSNILKPEIILALVGNPSAVSASSGTNTFELFDDFNTGATPDSTKWTSVGGTVNLVDGQLQINAPAPVDTEEYMRSISLFSPTGLALEVREKRYIDADSGVWYGFTSATTPTVANMYNGKSAFWNDHRVTAPEMRTHTAYLGNLTTVNTANKSASFRTFKIELVSTSQTRFYIDDVLEETHTTNIPDVSMYVAFNGTYYNAQLECRFDDVRVRKYVSPEPIIQKLRTLNRALLIKHLGRAG